MPPPAEWHGWRLGAVSYNVERLPRRRSIALYRHEGVESHSVAWFRTEPEAAEFLDWLDSVFGLLEEAYGVEERRPVETIRPSGEVL